jgi:hypothetical protein
MADIKNIKYLNKDFSQFRKNLIDFAKTYFPDTYNDFNESSPGMMFIEMASYVGDVLSFYMDSQLKESLTEFAEERSNVYSIAYGLGYQPKNYVASSTNIDFFQIVPSKGSGASTTPDMDYALIIPGNTAVASTENSSVSFRTIEDINFQYSSSISPTEVTVYQIDSTTSEPTFYLLKKSVKAESGTIKSQDFEFVSPKRYDKITLTDENIINIVDIYDSDDNRWYEVQYLAQDAIFDSIRNIASNDPELYQYNDTAPYLMKLKKTSKRFITRFNKDKQLNVQFGAGTNLGDDETIVPNPDNVGLALPYGVDADTNIDPSNFIYTRAYGSAPSDTTLTVRYTVGNGVLDNIGSNTLTDIISINPGTNTTGLNQSLLGQVKGSIACSNPEASSGGRSSQDIDEIRNDTLAFFAAQNRIITREDFIVRAYSMPAKFGAIAKAYIVPDDQLDDTSPAGTRIPNPLALNLYTLGYDSNNNLARLNSAVKENLKTYLDRYRMLTDAINIKDAFIINIGVNFEIIPRPNYNINEVILKCISTLKKMFNIKQWQMNQPIIKSDIYTELDKVDGVQTVTGCEIINLWDSTKGYSGNIYDIEAATKNGIIYPSLDPSIFEVKNSSTDIKGRAVSL